jgi:hypothetical protein
MSVKERLRELVDQLSEDEASETLAYLHDRLSEGEPQTEDDLDAMIAQQGVTPLVDPARQAQGIWPEDESVDDFIAALACWRSEGRDG